MYMYEKLLCETKKSRQCVEPILNNFIIYPTSFHIRIDEILLCKTKKKQIVLSPLDIKQQKMEG